MNGLVPELLALLVHLSGVWLFPTAMATVSWPALVSVASGGRVKETTEGFSAFWLSSYGDNWGCAWTCGRGLPPSLCSLWVGQSSFYGQGRNQHGLCSVQKMPPLRLCVFQSWLFPSSSSGPSVPWPFSSHQSPAKDQGRLSGRVVVCNENWAFDLSKKNAHFSNLAILINMQNSDKYLEIFLS